LGVDPYLQDTRYKHRVRLLTGFAAAVRSGYYGRGRTVTAATVSTALTAVGQTVALAVGVNPTKVLGGDNKLLPRLSQTLDGWRKSDPPPTKNLPVEADIPEYLCHLGLAKNASPLDKAVGDLAVIAFYYLLRVGEYTIKGTRNSSKQTVQFKVEDVTFFGKDSSGNLVQVGRNAPRELIMSAQSATLKLDNQKNGWRGVCIHQEANGESVACPVRALGQCYLDIRDHSADPKLTLSSYYSKGRRQDVTDKHIRAALKFAAHALGYPSRGFPIDRVDTHSLRSGGANALALAGYSDTQIQKMGRWKGATFKEYIREELHVFSAGMSRHMKHTFRFINISGGVYHDVTNDTIALDYDTVAAAA
jgi:hypothetical protein